MFFIDKYRPTNVNQLIYHKDIIAKLEKICLDDSIPNLIFYGPSSSGKKTLINIFLEMIYDETVHNMNDTKYTIVGSSSSSEVSILQSNFHILIEPNNNNSDKYIVQDIIKEYAMRAPMNFFKTKKTFKIVLIKNVQNLSYHAQTSLRRTMELYAKTCKFIMISSSLSKVIEPIKSRCHAIRVPRPTKQEILKTLQYITNEENIQIKKKEIKKIIKKCGRQIKECIWQVENKKYGVVDELDLHKQIKLLCSLLTSNDLKHIIKIRAIIYSVLITNISGSDLIKMIINELLEKINNPIKQYKIIQSASKYEHRLIMGRREITHLEGFVIDIMTILIDSTS